MVKFNPLLQSKKESVSIIRPQVVHNIVKQSEDKIIIDKLVDNKILVGKDNSVLSSKYSIQDLVSNLENKIPKPLIAGSNIVIEEGIINSILYDDAGIKQTIFENTDILNQKIEDVNESIRELKKNIETVDKSSKNSLLNLTNRFTGSLEKIDSINQEHKQTATNTINEMKQVFVEIDKLKDSNQLISKNLDHQMKEVQDKIDMNEEQVDSKFLQLNSNLSISVKVVEKSVNDYIEANKKEILDTKKNTIDNLADLKLNVIDIIREIRSNCSDSIEQVKSEVSESISEINKKHKVELEKLGTDIISLKTQIQDLKVCNPNSVEFSKTLKTLNDKINAIDKKFKFK